MIEGRIIPDRDMSGFPVSVGTGLALETLFEPVMDVIDPEREVKKVVDINRYNVFLFNIETLARNMFNAIPKEVITRYTQYDILATLNDEINFIAMFFRQNGFDVRFYYNTHKVFKTKYKDRLREPSTARQIRQELMIAFCMTNARRLDEQVMVFNDRVRYKSSDRVLMLTHFPADLLSSSNFRILDLLESHTGTVKSQREFNTKYFKVPRQDMSFLPFWESLLVTFGDSVMFRPARIRKRIEVYELMLKEKVNPLTPPKSSIEKEILK